MRLAKIGLLFTGLAAFLASAGPARADLSIMVYEDGNTAKAVTYSTTGTSLTLSGTPTSGTLAMAAPDYSFTGIIAMATIGNPQGGINLTGTIGSASTALHTLTILVSENAFVSGGPSYSMGSSSGYSFNVGNSNNAPDPDSSFSFKSYATPGSMLFGMGVPSPGHTYSGLGFPTGSGSFNEAATPFTAAAGYSLTESYAYTSHLAGETFQPTGSTIATPSSVPEPASILLLAFGAGSAGLIAARRRSPRRSGCLDSRTGDDRVD